MNYLLRSDTEQMLCRKSDLTAQNSQENTCAAALS